MTGIDLTADGRLAVHPYVSEAKFLEMGRLIDASRRGGFVAEHAALAARESLAEHDGAFSLAHLVNVRNLPKYDEAERNWTKIASVETVDDFEPTTFQSFQADFSNLEFGKESGGHQIAPKVAEGDTYSYAYGYSEESIKAAITKRGFKFGLTLEKLIGNFRKYIRTLPDDMLKVALDTDEFLVFDRLNREAKPANRIKADVNPITGAETLPNPTASAEAIRVGLAQVNRRKVNKLSVPLADGYWAVVQIGAGEALEDDIARAKALVTLTATPTGALAATYNAPSIGRLGKVLGVIESPYITEDGRWFLAPAAGSTRRPGLVKLELAGHTAPEVLISGFAGTPVRGGDSVFDVCHFDNDSVDLKLRAFTDSALITQDQLVWSDGTGEA